MNHLPHDPLLPALPQALDGAAMADTWSTALAGGPWRVARCDVERVKYRPLRNLSVCYRLTLGDAAGGRHLTQRVAARFCHGGAAADRAARALRRPPGRAPMATTAGPAVTHHVGLDMVAHWWPFDPRLPAARLLADGTLARDWLPALLADAGEQARCLHHRIDVVQVVPEHRMTLRADVLLQDGRRRLFYAKADAECRGPRTQAVMQALWDAPARQAGRLHVPQPLGWQAGSGLHWQAGIAGTPLLDLEDPVTAAGAGAAGEGLAALHGVATPAAPLDADQLAARLAEVVQTLGMVVPQERPRLQALAQDLAALPATLRSPVTLHGDLHPRNLLRDDAGRLHLIDLDSARNGPAALDLGAWAADALYRALLAGQAPGQALAAVHAFVDAYARVGGTRPDARTLARATAWQLLCQRAWRCAINLKPGRFALVSPLLGLATALSTQGHVDAAADLPSSEAA
ncbi:aminoglycoside phosphotransferase family protein [Rubrivivax albus]|nr:aminoglycoside phosphotransferase family protein [Rubrivivax albus]